MDFTGFFYRHVMGVIATYQAELNSYWEGEDWTLAER